jgi:hypothetical protein
MYADSGQFTGDMDFVSCQTVSSNSGVGVVFTDQGASNASLGGVKFVGCDLYGGNYTVEAGISGSDSQIGDLWFTGGTQFNVGANFFVLMQTSSAGQLIQDIHFEGVYFTATAQVGIDINCNSGGEIRSVFINGCFFDGMGNKAIYVDGADLYGVQITNNTFIGISNPGAQAVLINNGKGHTFIGNIMYNDLLGTNNVDYLVAIGSSANYVIATNNQSCGAPSSGCVLNLSDGAIIDNNNQ